MLKQNKIILFIGVLFLITQSLNFAQNFGKVKDTSNPDFYDESLQKSFYDGFFGTYNGSLISDNNITYKGKKAVDFYLTIQIPGSNLKYGKGRYFIENKILYLAVYFYSDFNKNDYDKYVNSIEF